MADEKEKIAWRCLADWQLIAFQNLPKVMNKYENNGKEKGFYEWIHEEIAEG